MKLKLVGRIQCSVKMRVFFGTGKRNRDERHGHGFNHAGEKRVGKKSFNLSAWGLGPFTTPHFNVEPNNLWVGAMFEKPRGGRWVRERERFSPLWGGNYNSTEAQRTLTFWPLLYKGTDF